jgi:hypothetical protein
MKKPEASFRAALPLALSCLVIVAFACCAGHRSPVETARIQGRRFTLHLVPGPEYEFATRWFIFSVPIYPQVACWIESPQGDYVDTIYVTAKGAGKTWVSAPPGGRPESLPVWFHLRKKRSAAVDTISGPTPRGDTTRDSGLAAALSSGTYVVKLEINRSYDYNDRYTRANSGVNGQPSLIYECRITVGEGPSQGIFEPIGTGSVDGSDGNVRPGLEGITTALKLLDSAAISYDEGAAQ